MRIIIPSDGSASCREAIRFIGERAKFMREKPVVELANVQYAIPESIIDRFGLEAVCTVYEAEGRAQLAECTKTAERAGLSVETRVLYGECGPALSREAQVFRADLIAMGSRGLSPAKSFFLGSVSRNVLANTMKPVLLARGESLPDRENLRLVLAVDGSNYGAAAAQFISENPGFFGPAPKVTVVSVMRDYSDLTRAGVTDYEPILRDTRERCEAENTRLWEEATEPVLDILRKADIEAEAVRLTGSPAEEITKYAKDHADMIVMGSHGWGRFKSAVLGSTATKIGALTHLPVLLIRIED